MGTLADNPAWPYVITLYGVLGLATGSAGWQSLSERRRGLALLLTGVSTGALMGFFYGGRLTDDNPQVAIAGAMLLGMLGLIAAWKAPPALSRTLLGTLGAIAAYGFAFLLWTDGSSLVTTGSWVLGLIRMALALVAIGITVRSLRASWAGLKTYGTTSFRETDLTACRFIDTALTHCDMDESFTLLE